MNAIIKSALAFSAVILASQASAQVTFYERDNFDGRSFSTRTPVDNLRRFGFNDRASSVVVAGGPWEVCEQANYAGRCMILRPGNYRSLRDMGMNDQLTSARALRANVHYNNDRYAPLPMPAQITFYEHDRFDGRAFNADRNVSNLQQFGFNDRASSAVVLGERWEVCEHVNFSGRCVILRPGRYPDLNAMGLNDRVSSVRAVNAGVRFDDNRYAPPPPLPVYDGRRRPQERVYEANVTSVRAVFTEQQQHCWVEREQVQRRDPNVGGALIGGIVGGILGHQVGGGSGRDLATVGGAVAGAVIGSNIGPDGRATTVQSVQRCSAAPAQGRPDYWDVTYNFRGVEHRMQTQSPPGATVNVNQNGEPRI